MDSRLRAVEEEIREVESLAELDALLADDDYSEYTPALQSVVDEVRQRFVEVPTVAIPQATAHSTTVVVHTLVRPGRKYKLLSTDVKWSTKPQVHAVMAILAAHLKVGDVVSESDIVRMMEANKGILATRQEPKRIWDYYKGNTCEGLLAHGNVEKI